MRSATRKSGARSNDNALLARWQETLTRRTGKPAVLAPDGETLRSFSDIEGEAQTLVERLTQWPAGSVLAIQIGNSPSWPAFVLAAMRCGLIPLPLGRHIEKNERDAALATCGATALVESTRGELCFQSVESQCRGASMERPEQDMARRKNASLSSAGTQAEIATGCTSRALHRSSTTPTDFLKLTSGTTSAPRAIRFQAHQLVADCDTICETMSFGEDDLNFGVIPFSHSYGFSNLITPLLCRAVPLVASEDRMPRAILHDLARSGATVFPGMPVFYEKFGEMENVPDLPRLRLCISAGAPLPRQVAERFSERFRGLKIHTFYGSSECGGIGYDASDTLDYEDGFIGTPMKNVQITPLDSGQDISRIQIESAAVGDGYFPDDDPVTLSCGRFIPGDLVRTTPRGMFLAGRASDVINIAGRKLNPAEVEAQLARFAGVRQVVVFGVPSALRNEEAVACVTGAVDASKLLRFARTVLSGWQVPKDIWLVQEIPVNERGKTSRRGLARRYLESRIPL